MAWLKNLSCWICEFIYIYFSIYRKIPKDGKSRQIFGSQASINCLNQNQPKLVIRQRIRVPTLAMQNLDAILDRVQFRLHSSNLFATAVFMMILFHHRFVQSIASILAQCCKLTNQRRILRMPFFTLNSSVRRKVINLIEIRYSPDIVVSQLF